MKLQYKQQKLYALTAYNYYVTWRRELQTFYTCQQKHGTLSNSLVTYGATSRHPIVCDLTLAFTENYCNTKVYVSILVSVLRLYHI